MRVSTLTNLYTRFGSHTPLFISHSCHVSTGAIVLCDGRVSRSRGRESRAAVLFVLRVGAVSLCGCGQESSPQSWKIRRVTPKRRTLRRAGVKTLQCALPHHTTYTLHQHPTEPTHNLTRSTHLTIALTSMPDTHSAIAIPGGK